MPNASTLSTSTRALYEAEDLAEGLKVINAMLPRWAAPCALVGGILGFAVVFKGRLALSKWRHRERENERGSSMAPSVFSGEDEFNDSSLLTFDEVEEFRRSLGIVLPRDADLMSQIETMLIDDPIPEGWELYRCSFGVRFRNTTTNTLAFFHPGAHELELHVRQELATRDSEIPGFRALANSGQQMFDQPAVDDDNSHQTTFMNVFDAFLKKERENESPLVATPRRALAQGNNQRTVGSMRASTIQPSRTGGRF